MKHAKTILALGIAVALLPFLGFPSAWKNIFFALLGGGIAVLAYRIMARSQSTPNNRASAEESVIPTTDTVVVE